MEKKCHFSPGDPVLVVGLGQSGEAAAQLLARRGARVTILDGAANPVLEERAARLRAQSIDVQLGVVHAPEEKYVLAVTSPGIPSDAHVVTDLRARGIPLLPELELGWIFSRGMVLAITGSAGKSTLAKLCYELLRHAGKRVLIGANYGMPLSALVLQETDWDWLVLEVSSFQLELIQSFRPDVGVLLNLHPNHLDRHRTLEAYTRAKMNLFVHMNASDHAIVQMAVFPHVRSLWSSAARLITFGTSAAADCYYAAGRLSGPAAGRRTVAIDGTYFDNEILGLTAAAAAAAMMACGVDPGGIMEVARTFEPLPHRMQQIAKVNGVCFIDDSKATTLAALAAGVHMAPGPVHLIAGGRLKEKDVKSFKKVLAKKIKQVYLIGESAELMGRAWSGTVACVQCGNLNKAVALAQECARSGETVLLSPGCASFDQFSGYHERGKRFQELIKISERRGQVL